MNAFKSALRLSKTEPNQNIQSLYEQVKSWDQARAGLLQNYLKVVMLAIDALDAKVGQVEKYIGGLDKLMSARIEEIVREMLFRLHTAKTESMIPSSFWCPVL